MFSGIVERVGTVERVSSEGGSRRLVLEASFDPILRPGESVAMNGVCLTVERADARSFEAVAVRETLDRTTLGGLETGSRVNLERALSVGQPLGGHWLQGHVDATAVIRGLLKDSGQVRLQVEIPEGCRRFVARKGSIALDGTSLTVADWADRSPRSRSFRSRSSTRSPRPTRPHPGESRSRSHRALPRSPARGPRRPSRGGIGRTR